ncbi:MAG: hypothetical protein Q7V58_06375 [Actinomycetota bacterium]|nr:hypothetical protein [Actinomycetota bacterium]
MAKGGPPGWPRDLPPRGTVEFDERVVGWLLDRAPADLRGSTLRQYPIALGRVVAHVVAGELDGIRSAYSTARSDLGAHLAADELATVQAALEAEGARLLAVQREVALVEEALAVRARTPGIKG